MYNAQITVPQGTATQAGRVTIQDHGVLIQYQRPRARKGTYDRLFVPMSNVLHVYDAGESNEFGGYCTYRVDATLVELIKGVETVEPSATAGFIKLWYDDGSFSLVAASNTQVYGVDADFDDDYTIAADESEEEDEEEEEEEQPKHTKGKAAKSKKVEPEPKKKPKDVKGKPTKPKKVEADDDGWGD